MTTTTIETDLDHAVEDLTVDAIPCEGLVYEDAECPNEAVYKMEVVCCAARFNWCEKCLFDFIEYAREWIGDSATCVYCQAQVVLEPNHVKVIGRIK